MPAVYGDRLRVRDPVDSCVKFPNEIVNTMSTATESTAVEPKLWTTADLLALPDDGVERWLINGELREFRDPEMTKRNRWHSQVMMAVGYLLTEWLKQRPEPRGEVHGGEVGCILSHDPETTVGIDVAYFGPEIIAIESEDTPYIDGAPVLAVEILSPYDTLKVINEKIRAYLAAGVKLVWIVDPYQKTVLVHRPDAPPELFNITQTLTAEPHLPGFSTPVTALFE